MVKYKTLESRFLARGGFGYVFYQKVMNLRTGEIEEFAVKKIPVRI